MNQKLRKLVFLKFFSIKTRTFFSLLIFLIIAFLGYNFLNFIKAASLHYVEDFTSTTYKDDLYTSAVWTGDGQVTLDEEFVRQDGSKSYIENISNDDNLSQYPLIFLDDKNQPYVIWESTPGLANSDIVFTRGNLATLQWEKMNGSQGSDNVSNTIGSSNIDRVAVSSSGNPYIVWQDNTLPGGDGIYGTGDDTTGGASDYEILFTYWDGTQWAKMDGSPGVENISNQPGLESKLPRIILDPADNPYVVY